MNDIGYKLVFHNYSKFASNTWYTLICKFEKYETPQILHGYEHILPIGFEKNEKLKIKWK